MSRNAALAVIVVLAFLCVLAVVGPVLAEGLDGLRDVASVAGD